MSDDKKKTGKADRGRVSAQLYEIRYVAKKAGVKQALVRRIIRLGHGRRTVEGMLAILIQLRNLRGASTVKQLGARSHLLAVRRLAMLCDDELVTIDANGAVTLTDAARRLLTGAASR